MFLRSPPRICGLTTKILQVSSSCWKPLDFCTIWYLCSVPECYVVSNRLHIMQTNRMGGRETDTGCLNSRSSLSKTRKAFSGHMIPNSTLETGISVLQLSPCCYSQTKIIIRAAMNTFKVILISVFYLVQDFSEIVSHLPLLLINAKLRVSHIRKHKHY
jgi:hypothetical protein